MLMNPSGLKPLEYVVLVRGTFAADENDDKLAGQDRWWQRGSEFAIKLSDGVEHSAADCENVVAPEIEFFDDLRPWWARLLSLPRLSSTIGVFHWSGANSESAQLAGVFVAVPLRVRYE
jgi:hypothetical protein